MTPPIPDWMKNTRVSGYTNIYELLPNEPRVYGTESLFGDWNGRVLLLAQDFAPAQFVKDRIANGDADPFRHEPRLRTNISLLRHTQSIRYSDDPLTCGVLYGSALAGLCKNEGGFRGKLDNIASAAEYGSRVLRHTIQHMKRLQVVVALGNEPSAMIAATLCDGVDWKLARDSNTPVRTREGFYVVFASHPVASIKREVVRQRWNTVASLLLRTQAA